MQKNSYPGGVTKKNILSLYGIVVILVVVFDEWTKKIMLTKLPDQGSLLQSNLIDFSIHKNIGIAFDLPFKIPFIIIFSVVLGFLLICLAYKNINKRPTVSLALIIMIIGAAGNLFDRLVYGFAVDYILLFGRSAFNLSDIVIIIGIIVFLLASRTKNITHPEYLH